jgi:hypothetical protein
MKIKSELQKTTTNLIGGGWYPEDKDELREEYNLTDQEVENIITEMKKIIVKNSKGNWIDYAAAAGYMDDDIREDLHAELAPCSNQEFYDAYAKAHLNKFGQEYDCENW